MHTEGGKILLWKNSTSDIKMRRVASSPSLGVFKQKHQGFLELRHLSQQGRLWRLWGVGLRCDWGPEGRVLGEIPSYL